MNTFQMLEKNTYTSKCLRKLQRQVSCQYEMHIEGAFRQNRTCRTGK